MLKGCRHAWIMHCIQGKDKSKPYDWAIPKNSIGGTQCAHKMMSVTRLTPPQGEQPWPLGQWGPNTTDPMTGDFWRNKPIAPHQLKKAHQRLMREYPLCAKFDMECCAYQARRIGPSFLTQLNVAGPLRTAFGNWKDKDIMPDHYTETKLQISMKAKHLIVTAIQNTIKSKNGVQF